MNPPEGFAEGSAVFVRFMTYILFSEPAQLNGRFLLVVRTSRVKTLMKCPGLLPQSLYTQTIKLPTTMTSLCSDSPHQSSSQTTWDLCVWQRAAACSSMALTAGSLAGVRSESLVSIGWVQCSRVLYSVCLWVNCLQYIFFLQSAFTIPSNSSRGGGSSYWKPTV